MKKKQSSNPAMHSCETKQGCKCDSTHMSLRYCITRWQSNTMHREMHPYASEKPTMPECNSCCLLPGSESCDLFAHDRRFSLNTRDISLWHMDGSKYSFAWNMDSIEIDSQMYTLNLSDLKIYLTARPQFNRIIGRINKIQSRDWRNSVSQCVIK